MRVPMYIVASFQAILVLLVMVSVRPAVGQCQELKLSPEESSVSFGTSVDLDVDAAAAGAPDGSFANIYRLLGSEWAFEQRVQSESVGDKFGRTLELDGDHLVVGAHRDSGAATNAGAAYVYHSGELGWSQQAVLRAEDGQASDNLGFDVAISGDRVVAGAPGVGPLPISGAAYIFENQSSWVETTRLVAWDNASPIGSFGKTVAIDDDVVVVSSPDDGDGGTRSGAVYIFRNDGTDWVPESKLVPSDTQPYLQFGAGLALDGSRLAIGAPLDASPNGYAGSGSIYIYEHNGSDWIQKHRLQGWGEPWTGGLYFRLGNQVGLAGDLLVAGASRDWMLGESAGSAFVYQRAGSNSKWCRFAKLVGQDTAAFDHFGDAVATNGTLIMAGAELADTSVPNSGAAYIFDTQHAFEDCNGNWIDDVCEIAVGVAPDMNADGTPDDCPDLDDVEGPVLLIDQSRSVLGAASMFFNPKCNQQYDQQAQDLTPFNATGSAGCFRQPELGLAQGGGSIASSLCPCVGIQASGSMFANVERYQEWGVIEALGASRFEVSFQLIEPVAYELSITAAYYDDARLTARIVDPCGTTELELVANQMNQVFESGAFEPGFYTLSVQAWADLDVQDAPAAYASAEYELDLQFDVLCSADVNQDGTVDIADLVTLILNWGICPPRVACPADLNFDGRVDTSDLILLILGWS